MAYAKFDNHGTLMDFFLFNAVTHQHLSNGTGSQASNMQQVHWHCHFMNINLF
jgi:hypothetical protein